ncbi:MAG: hypothetical protein LBR26_00020 [Prevotella sp.]|nr:hypothetical protein [Prevotella sp.]
MNEDAVFYIANSNLFIWSARPNNIDFRNTSPKEREKNALSEETGKRFSRYCLDYCDRFIHGGKYI